MLKGYRVGHASRNFSHLPGPVHLGDGFAPGVLDLQIHDEIGLTLLPGEFLKFPYPVRGHFGHQGQVAQGRLSVADGGLFIDGNVFHVIEGNAEDHPADNFKNSGICVPLQQ